VTVRSSTSLPAFLLAAVIVLLTPTAWQVILAGFGPDAGGSPSYLPALEKTRVRRPFDTGVVPGLQQMAPGFVIIGDSMAGRVHFDRLRDLTGEEVAPILQNATGSAYWYLAFKNFVVASGVKPKWTLVFFRDTNLTDPMFRLSGAYRSTLDEVALDREDELNRIVAARATGPWHTIYGLIDRVYGAERARAWLEPHVASWPARVVADATRAPALLTRINDAFSLDHLRPMAQADLEAAADRDADFATNAKTSVLPGFVTLARERGVRVCFIRVLRRPVDGAPPVESAALRRYVADLRAYLGDEGACFLDDRDDPRLLSIPYEDGDHIKREGTVRYTELLVERLAQLVR